VAVLRSRRIETLLGTSLDAIRHSHLASLVTGKVSETFDVDFKGTLFGKLDDDKRNLAGDVAALANTAGGFSSWASRRTSRPALRLRLACRSPTLRSGACTR